MTEASLLLFSVLDDTRLPNRSLLALVKWEGIRGVLFSILHVFIAFFFLFHPLPHS